MNQQRRYGVVFDENGCACSASPAPELKVVDRVLTTLDLEVTDTRTSDFVLTLAVKEIECLS